MRIELTDKGNRIFANEERDGIQNITGFLQEALETGALVVKDDAGRTILDDKGDDDQKRLGVDSAGRDRSLRIGGAAPNERNDATAGKGNTPPDAARAQATEARRGSADDGSRLDKLEEMVGKLVASLYPPDTVRRAVGTLPPEDTDDDPRTSRPYNIESDKPVALTNNPRSRALLDELFEDTPDRGGPVKRSMPLFVHPADPSHEHVLKALAEEAGYTVTKKRGDFAVGNGAPLSREETMQVVKGLMANMGNDNGGLWGNG